MVRIGRHGANGHLAVNHSGAAQLEWHLWIDPQLPLDWSLWNQSVPVPVIAERSPGHCQRVLALGRGAQAATSRGEGVCRPVGRGGLGGFREAPGCQLVLRLLSRRPRTRVLRGLGA